MLDPIESLLRDFLSTSATSLQTLVHELTLYNRENRNKVTFSLFQNGKSREVEFEGDHFFLRTSTEYSSPQLTLEELQGIIAARLLEVCGNYLENKGKRDLEHQDVMEIAENLRKPPQGRIIPFVLNTDEIEPDRYSNNPFRNSILTSGQSAFTVASITTSKLKIDPNFCSKYLGSLIAPNEVDFIQQHLHDKERYLDFVDLMKGDSLKQLSEILGIHLTLPIKRMPLAILAKEKRTDPIHLTISNSHRDRDAIKAIYELMGRSIKKKRTLLTIPHSEIGFASKRAAKGKLVFDGNRLQRVAVRYRTAKLYPNMADPDDISIAHADDMVSIEAEKFINYDYVQTPSSPLFALYILFSPENASLSHGVGEWAGSHILRSYCSMCEAFVENAILKDVPRTHLKLPPLALNLIPDKMWLHPKYENFDASMGCIEKPLSLLKMGMAVEYLNYYKNR
jgi:hypothetical protein